MISVVACCHSVKLCAHAARVSDRNTVKSLESATYSRVDFHSTGLKARNIKQTVTIV